MSTTSTDNPSTTTSGDKPNKRRGTVRRMPDGRWKIGMRAPGCPRAYEYKPADWSEIHAWDYAEAETDRLTKLAKQKRALGAVAASGKAKLGETVAQYAERWHDERERRGLASNRQDRNRMATHVLPVLGPKPIASVTQDDLRALVLGLDRRVQDGTLSWSTARLAWGLVTKMMSDAVASKDDTLRVLQSNPALGVCGPNKGDSKAKQWLYPSELLALVSCESLPLRWRRLYALSVYLYTRPGELEALTWHDLDVERGTVNIHQAVDREHGGLKSTKTGNTRRFAVEPALLPLVRAMHAETGGKGNVVSMPPVEDLSATLRDHLKRAGVKRADLFADSKTQKRITFYDLRATGITWRAVRGDKPLQIQRNAGHKRFSTTEGYVRSAEDLEQGFGEPFPALPKSLSGGADWILVGSKLKNPQNPREILRPQRDSKARKPRNPRGLRRVPHGQAAPAFA